MNQRVLSTPSMLLSKAFVGRSDVASEMHRVTSNPRLTRSSSTSASSPKTSSNSSSSSFRNSSVGKFHHSSSNVSKQFELQRSSSSLLSMTSNQSRPSLASGLMRNATWGEVTAAKSSNASWGEVVATKPSPNPFVSRRNDAKASLASNANPFLDGTYDTTPRSTRRRSSLSSLAEDDLNEPFTQEIDSCAIGDLDTETFVVSTFQEKTPKVLGTGHLSVADLASLKKTDAFFYYSIPQVKKALREGKDVDFDVDCTEPVKRCSAISFETADLLDLNISSTNANPNEALYGSDVDDNDDDFFMFYLESCAQEAVYDRLNV